jgi:hypothetical protein
MTSRGSRELVAPFDNIVRGAYNNQGFYNLNKVAKVFTFTITPRT